MFGVIYKSQVPEAKGLVEDRLREVVAMPFDDLLRFIDHPADTEVTAPSGRTYRSRTYSFWDMEPFESDLLTRVQVTGRGLYRYRRYFGVDVRQPGTDSGFDPSDNVDISSAWAESLAFLVLGIGVLLLVAPLVIGVVYLISMIT